jgi:hypothetical protein
MNSVYYQIRKQRFPNFYYYEYCIVLNYLKNVVKNNFKTH